MPYKDEDKQREVMRNYMQERREREKEHQKEILEKVRAIPQFQQLPPEEQKNMEAAMAKILNGIETIAGSDENTGKDMAVELAKAQIVAEQATELLRRRDAEQNAKDDMEKAVLIVKISQDNKLFNRQVLSNPKFTLRLLRRLDNILAAYKHDATKHEAQVRAEDSSGKVKKGLTVGEYDQKTGEWKT